MQKGFVYKQMTRDVVHPLRRATNDFSVNGLLTLGLHDGSNGENALMKAIALVGTKWWQLLGGFFLLFCTFYDRRSAMFWSEPRVKSQVVYDEDRTMMLMSNNRWVARINIQKNSS